jgi:hypothetical protein
MTEPQQVVVPQVVALKGTPLGSATRPEITLGRISLSESNGEVPFNHDTERKLWHNSNRTGSGAVGIRNFGELDTEKLAEVRGASATSGIKSCALTVIEQGKVDPKARQALVEAIGNMVIDELDLLGEKAAARTGRDLGTVHTDGSVTPPKQLTPPSETGTNGAHPELATAQ